MGIHKVYNTNLKEVIKEYPNEITLFEEFSIDGKPFIEVIDEISDANAYIDVFSNIRFFVMLLFIFDFSF